MSQIGEYAFADKMTDRQNLQKEIALEKEAIENYKADIDVCENDKVKKLFEHILGEEQEHFQELNEALKELGEILNSEDNMGITLREHRINAGKEVFGKKINKEKLNVQDWQAWDAFETKAQAKEYLEQASKNAGLPEYETVEVRIKDEGENAGRLRFTIEWKPK